MAKKVSDCEITAFVWCVRNGYKVFPVTNDNSSYKVCVLRGSDEFVFTDVYNKNTIWDGVYDVIMKIYKQKA